jgi:hypothetical protein
MPISGWISNRHRLPGDPLLMTDIDEMVTCHEDYASDERLDFPVLEYRHIRGPPRGYALIDYKEHHRMGRYDPMTSSPILALK